MLAIVHQDIRKIGKIDFLKLGEEPIDNTNYIVGKPEKKFSINFIN